MRPLRLLLDNFTCFRGAQPALDFADLELFAIAGPTGSGKSSLLDAMLFALYGTVPRLPRARSAADLISLGRDRLAVVFDFSVGEAAYRVARSVRRRASIASEAQLERLPPGGGDPEPMADGVTAVNAELQRLLALSYDAFAQAVVLPQGEFARFLRSPPKDRQRILRDLLRLSVFERMRQQADAESRLAEAALNAAEDVLATLGDATPEALAALEARLTECRERLRPLPGALRECESRVEELRARATRCRELAAARESLAILVGRDREITAAAERLARARAAERVLPLVEAAEQARGQAERSRELAAAADDDAGRSAKVHAAAVESLAAAERAAAALPGIAADLERLVRAEALVAPLEAAQRGVAEASARVATRRAGVQRLRAALKEAESAATRAGRAATAAQAAAARAAAHQESRREGLEQARRALREAERRHAVAHLRRGLKKGDACPVCERPLGKKPRALGEADLPALEAALGHAEQDEAAAHAATEEARARAEAAQRDSERGRLEAQGSRERLEAAEASVAEGEQDLAAARERQQALEVELRKLVPDGDPRERAGALRERQQGLAAALERAQREASAAAATLASVRARAASLREAAGDAGGRQTQAERRAAEAAAEAGFADLDAVRAAALPAARQQAVEQAVLAHQRERHALEERVALLEAGLAGGGVEAGQLEAAEQRLAALRSERDAAVRSEATLEERRENMRRRLEQAAARRRELDKARERHATLRQLALDLQAGAFQAWLLEESFAELVDGASRRLLELSGRYGLAHEDKAFYVVDHDNAGERRRAETLSGGETFLASLALALELSQQVQRAAGAVPLESLFIDEGFGTLDPETLDAVTSAIESLPRVGRVVGVVTHLRELTDRLPARIRVTKHAGGSSARVEPA